MSRSMEIPQMGTEPQLFRSYLRVLSYGAHNGGVFAIIVGIISAIGSGVALPLMNVVFGRLVGDFTQYFVPGSGFTKEQFLAAVARNTMLILYLFVVKFVFTYIFTLCFRFVGLHASGTLRLKYIKALFAQPVSKLDEISSGTVINAVVSSSNTIQQSISDRLPILFQTLTILVTAYAIAFHYSWTLTLVVSSATVFIAVCVSITTPVLVRLLHRVNEADDRHLSIATEVFGSIRTVLSLNAEEALTERYVHWVNESRNRGLKISVVGAVHLGLVFFGVYCSFSLAFWYGLRQLYFGQIDDVNTIITVFMSVLIAVMVMGQIAAPLMIISKAIGSTGPFFDIIDAPPEPPRSGLRDPQVSSEEDIVFEDVTFAYPSRPTVSVLHKFNARFHKGRTTALVGPSGSGKSTAMALLEGWYRLPKREDDSGGIFVGGQNINHIDLKWWRTQVGLVQQEPQLFNDTVYNNICFGLIGSRWENSANLVKWNLIVAACKEAYAHDFIQRLPAGYETVIGESGITLSGGQRQRLAIARSIVSKPAVLILDEATSSIDIHSEKIVQAALDRVARNSTTIIIAHRLSTIRRAEHIIAMGDGTNLQEGTHSELMERGGLYRQLVDAQQLHADTDAPIVDECDSPILESEDEGHAPLQSDSETVANDGHSTQELRFNLLRGVGGKRLLILLMVAIVAALGAAAGFSLQSWLFAKLIDSFRFFGDLLDAAHFWALVFFILALSMGACYSMLGYSSNSISMHIGSKARIDYFSRILRNPVPYFDKEENCSGMLVSRHSADTKQVQDSSGIASTFPIVAALSATGSLVIACIYGWKLALGGVVSVLPVLATAAFLRVRHQLQLEALNAQVYAESSGFISEAVRAFRTIVALTMEDSIVNRYTKLLQEQQTKATRRSWYSSLDFAFSDSMELLAMALSFWYGGHLLASREYDIVSFFVVYIAIIQAAGSAGVFLSFFPSIAQTRDSARRILMEASDVEKKGCCSATDVFVLPPTTPGQIDLELSRVSFQYPTRGSPTLEDLNFKICGGQFVAFVGPSGCGKSTLISLLERFYEPTRGEILFSGRNLRELDVASYRRALALVGQEPELFGGSIRENLLLGLNLHGHDHDGDGDDDDAESEMERACQQAKIHDFIMSLPDGYSTELGTNAQVSLSGGQKQRLCIARALLRNPSVLLLDEATSSLDSESERLIQDSLERLAAERDMIIVAVAHRLATIQKADCIYVFGDGAEGEGSRIAERGTHQELLKHRGLNFRCVKLRLSTGNKSWASRRRLEVLVDGQDLDGMQRIGPGSRFV